MIALHFADRMDVLRSLADNSVDSIVTDPEYGIRFMGKKWDYDVPPTEMWIECLRILKPGGYLLSFGGTRTYHRLVVRIEDAGFIIHPMIAWVFGSGFPKATRVEDMPGWAYGLQSLKPAIEPICMAQKPFDEKTGAAGIAKWGVGAVNIDGCRVGEEFGRWPANLIHDGSEEVLSIFPNAPGQMADASANAETRKTKNVYGEMRRGRGDEPSADSDNEGIVGFKMKPGMRRLDTGSAARFFYCSKASKKDRDEGLDEFADRVLARSCQAQAEAIRGNTVGQKAGAFNQARIRKNNHPTVKPTDLMRYLVRLVTPVSGTVLDPNMGSGSTGKAAILEGFGFIGIDNDRNAFEIAQGRVAHAAGREVYAPDVEEILG